MWTTVRCFGAWGSGGYWAERIGFLCDIRQVVFNPNLFPYENMEGKIDRPEEYADIATKCVTNFREKNRRSLPGDPVTS